MDSVIFQLLGFTILAWIVGYILHCVYRIVYYFMLRKDRKLIIHLKDKLKTHLHKPLSRERVELIYEYCFYSNKNYSSHITQIKEKSQQCSGTFTTIIGCLCGLTSLIICILIGLYQYPITLFLIAIYFLITIILGISYFIHFDQLNKSEMFLVDKNFEKELWKII